MQSKIGYVRFWELAWVCVSLFSVHFDSCSIKQTHTHTKHTHTHKTHTSLQPYVSYLNFAGLRKFNNNMEKNRQTLVGCHEFWGTGGVHGCLTRGRSMGRGGTRRWKLKFSYWINVISMLSMHKCIKALRDFIYQLCALY